jgi:hypothetical protein
MFFGAVPQFAVAFCVNRKFIIRRGMRGCDFRFFEKSLAKNFLAEW